MNWQDSSVAAPACGRYRRGARPNGTSGRRGAGLGSARVMGVPSWAVPGVTQAFSATFGLPAPAAPAGATMVRIPETLLRLMEATARAAGRSENEVWAEAARVWLRLRDAGDEPQPPASPAAALPVPRAGRSWDAIDALLADLRAAPVRDGFRTDPAA